MSSFQASGQESLTWLRGQSQDGVLVPPYATFRTWLPGNKPSPVQKPSTTPAQAATIPNSPEAIKAEIARLQGAYKTSLQSKVDSLKAKIEAMQEELVAAELELEELSA
ncbi:hypothetical protein [Pseudomonas monteilii]|uniref:hypothetical protein n=1 Tax=Pseudomonas monteilii TaxID=76759 RepID=UPI0012B6760D|nr:hypothetical protein [Pseudomonas monteilii]